MFTMIGAKIAAVFTMCILGVGGGPDEGLELYDLSKPAICRQYAFRWPPLMSVPWWAGQYHAGVGLDLGWPVGDPTGKPE